MPKKLSDKNKLVIFLIFLIAFFIILTIVYYSKESVNEKLVVSKNVRNIQTINELNIGVYNEETIDTINPITNDNEIVRNISELIYDKLFELKDNTYMANSKIIENYAKIDDKNYVFKLKENIFFQNGEKLTSRNIKETVETIFSNENSYYFECVDNIQSVKVIDNNMFRVNLIEADNDFCKKLIFPIILGEQNVGTNNYSVKEIANNCVCLENKGNGQVININIYSDIETMYRDFKQKKIDVIKPQKTVDYKRYIGEFGYIDKSYKGNDYICLEFNKKVYSTDSNLKQAILYAINSEEIIKKIFKGEAYDVKSVRYDLDKSIDILEKEFVYKNGGWYNGDWVFSVKLAINDSMKNNIDVIYDIKEQLEKVGIYTELILPSDEGYSDKIALEEYDVLVNMVDITKCEELEFGEKLICNKLHMLYSPNVTGVINPNVVNVFNDISSWKKIVR